jgi:hypothetical protein
MKAPVFYVAGPKKDQEFVKGVAETLRREGYGVNSRWLEIDKKDDEVDQDYLEKMALWDFEDVLKSDVLCYVNTGTKSEGKATELGIALGMMKPIIVIGGKANNIFLNLPLQNFPTIEEAIEWMKSMEYRFMLSEGIR